MEPAIKIVPFPESEIDFDMKSTVFLYPHKNSKKISEFTLQELEEIKNVVAIECTWNQTNVFFCFIFEKNFYFFFLGNTQRIKKYREEL